MTLQGSTFLQNSKDFKNTPERATGDQKCCERAGCDLRAVANSKYCAIHQHLDRTELYDFDKVRIANRIDNIRKHPDSRNLEVELALIRHLLEKIVNVCKEDTDFIRFSGQIMQMVDKISNLLKTNIQVSQVTHQLLSIEEVVTIAQSIVAIVAEYLDVDTLQEVSERVEKVLVDAAAPE